ncbi:MULTISPECIES: hypothetical protein [unclassified Mesorhizobium]|uniref:hypothetical protein n=1 Tax=unclassified Mesorhizobium TaxID=325217 RepID=UPI001CCF121B|nr:MULTISPECIES: hypothetical protein [unclassified Mesorhizobium]MBZ9684642.1 hypothetical protein [Mesorhizobium sp. CO1-1-2]MBZ9924566.1 hypothetical protein [Mesorhizobium sp. BR1-1-4]
MRTCRAAHCGAPTSSRFSPHCRRHKSRLRRQGDVEQTAIRQSELALYVSLVRERIAKNAHNPLWGHLDARWAALATSAKNTAGNRVQSRYQRQAAHEVLNLDAECSARDIAVTAMAMFLFWSERPERFLSDAAFRLQLVKRVRSLSSRHSGLRYDHRTGKQERVYRELSPKAGMIVARDLTAAFGGAGLQLAELEKRDQERKQAMTDEINQALRELV